MNCLEAKNKLSGWEQNYWENFHQPEIGSFSKAVALAVKARNAIGISAASRYTCSETACSTGPDRGKGGLRLCPLLREEALSVDNPSGCFLYLAV